MGVMEVVERYRVMLSNRVTPWVYTRWGVWTVLMLVTSIRVITLDAYIWAYYLLVCHVLKCAVLLITPRGVPSILEEDEGEEGWELPGRVQRGGEDRPAIISRTGERIFWGETMPWTVCVLIITFIPWLDVQVFWPLLLLYVFYLSYVLYSRQREHMGKYGYTLKDFYRKDRQTRG